MKAKPTPFGDDDEVSVSRVFRSHFPAGETSGFRSKALLEFKLSGHKTLEPLYPTMLHAFASAAKQPHGTGVTLLPEDEDDAEQFKSYRELWEDARTLASGLHALGVQKGDTVVVVLPTCFEFITSFYALQMVGAVPVPCYPPAALERVETGLERISHIATHAQAKMLVTNRALWPLLGAVVRTAPVIEHLTTVEHLRDKGHGQRPKLKASAKVPCFIQYTSGSTGSPKGVVLSHQNLVSNLHATGIDSKVGPTDRMVSWLPLYHDMGLIGGLLFPIYWKLPLVLMSPTAFLMRPHRWLQAISRFQGTLSASPNFGYALAVKRIRPSEREGLDLSSWRFALNGAEPVNLRSLRDFEEAYRPHGLREGVVTPCYGLAECTVGVTFCEPGKPLRHRVVERAALRDGLVVERKGQGTVALVCCGTPIAGHEVAVVDEHGTALPQLSVGHILVKGPSVMLGYHRDEAATEKVIKQGWLWTGDLGFLTPEGLYITGRAKDLIIVRGKNFYAEDLEMVAERVKGTRPGGTAAFGVYDDEKASDSVVLVVETKVDEEPEQKALVNELIEKVGEHAGVKLDQVVLVPPGTIPKTSSGKRQRGACRERYLEQNLVPQKTGTLGLAKVFARSAAGFIGLLRRKK